MAPQFYHSIFRGSAGGSACGQEGDVLAARAESAENREKSLYVINVEKPRKKEKLFWHFDYSFLHKKVIV